MIYNRSILSQKLLIMKLMMKEGSSQFYALNFVSVAVCWNMMCNFLGETWLFLYHWCDILLWSYMSFRMLQSTQLFVFVCFLWATVKFSFVSSIRAIRTLFCCYLLRTKWSNLAQKLWWNKYKLQRLVNIYYGKALLMQLSKSTYLLCT